MALLSSSDVYNVDVPKGTICQMVPFSPHVFWIQYIFSRTKRYHMTNGTFWLSLVLSIS